MNVAALISGGVDSSVALHKLAAEGRYKLTAFYLKIWLEDELAYLGDCPWEEDLKYAHAVCKQLGVNLEVVPLQAEYWDRVVSYTIDELKAGHTPSPDILCNQRVKFGAFVDKIDNSFDFIMSGHYATMRREQGVARLLRGVDPVKDQTYFLSHMSREQLERCLFPLGVLQKSEVRQLAAQYDLANQQRPDSQGICFLGKIKFRDFVKFHLGEVPGAIVHMETDKVLGEHQGYWFHTVGQRKGLGLSGGPWFVVGKDISKNIVYVSHQEHYLERAKDSFFIRQANWIHGEPDLTHSYHCKVRHGAKLYSCTLFKQNDEIGVKLDQADAGIAPGQFCVVYDSMECLGGGMIR